MLLGVDAPRLRVLFPTTPDPLAAMTTLDAALGWRPKFDEVAAALRRGFEEEHGLVLEPGALDLQERAQAERLVADKYGTEAWLVGAA